MEIIIIFLSCFHRILTTQMMIKEILAVPVILSLFLSEVSAQVIETSGKPIAEIFTDFHININDTTKHTGFDLNRAHVGYQFKPGGNLTAKIMLNIGSPEDLSAGAEDRRYAYFKEASLTWANEKLSLSMGITSTRLAEFQQKFWGKRYIANSYQSMNDYGYVADLGVTADYRFNKIFKADITLMNGEGYSELQLDNNIRSTIGFTVTPTDYLAFRIYGDIMRQENLWQKICYIFAGFKNPLITIGAEASLKTNSDLINGHTIWGLSATGGINITEKTEIFGRYDYSTSVIMPGEETHWNYLNDGRFSIIGIQYSFTENVKMALDYQGVHPFANVGMVSDLIYVNALFRF